MEALTNRFPVKTIKGATFIDFSDIIRIEADGKHTLFFIKNLDKHIRSTLTFGSLEEMLPSNFFFTCNRSEIINLTHLKEFEKSTRTAYLTDNHRVIISEDRIEDFRSKTGL
ncbi:MAG TPA: LytTR family DNA-binding domain-containing protein [Bacteroidales bacterium]|nr:LytTR family DNA-binding domain-containing protein [Bacteroidales bacterium]